MAPTSISAKALQQNRPRPAIPKAIEPAIPLAYVQKRQKQQVAHARTLEKEAAPATIAALPAVEESPSPPSPISETVVANGSSSNIDSNSNGPPILAEKEVESIASSPSEASGIIGLGAVTDPAAEEAVALAEDSSEVARPTPRSAPSEALSSSASRSTYQMPPAFVPAGTGQFPTMSPDNHQYPPLPSFHPMHHAHHRIYTHPDGMINHGPPAENFARRQMGQFQAPEGCSPSATPIHSEQRYNSFDPSTPHSFHGSQSSAPENGPAFYNQLPPAVVSSGSTGHVEDVRLYQPPHQKLNSEPRGVPPPGPNPSAAFHPQALAHPPPHVDHYDGLVNYLQNQFADPTFADFTLELRYSDDRAPPVRIPGHNLIFARSPTLKNLMIALARDTNSDGITTRTLLIESADRYLRSDAFWMAMQRLYGGPLLDVGTVARLNVLPNTQMPPEMPGTPIERFDLALGYAAAGQILRMPPVINRGIEIACHFVGYATLQPALQFALDGGLDSQWTDDTNMDPVHPPSTYGPAVNMLLHSCLNFMVQHFLPNFKLDTSVPDFKHSSRLPVVPDDRTAAPNPRLSFIKFGDHAAEESVKSVYVNSDTLILSSMLINMPFFLLKYVLESSRLGNVEGWATAALRRQVMYATIEERERRRIKVFNNRQVSNAERQSNNKAWEPVGWQEVVDHLDAPEAKATFSRRWVDYRLPTTSN
ncbi:hypothetical protein BJ875DRAFT_532140 [Amylocarpus encephaloides]|uniref:Uncharacterized protein n=1 Tax=Amylocarpus encephaloides TaxID=45428 RepID=A0A9P7YT58_9HELO|nr:hypothetical protein BJ875DRAFT_532140 [Amylocarpus encephaloides]